MVIFHSFVSLPEGTGMFVADETATLMRSSLPWLTVGLIRGHN
jgi:hypothetical protein